MVMTLRNKPARPAVILSIRTKTLEGRTPAYKYSGYTKQTAWIDTKEMRPVKVEFFDRKRRKLKTLTWKGYRQYIGRYWRASEMFMQNHQTGKST